MNEISVNQDEEYIEESEDDLVNKVRTTLKNLKEEIEQQDSYTLSMRNLENYC